MRTVLVIAPLFPPVGGGGVQRITKFVRYLPEFGWNPVVLTIDKPAYAAVDPGLLAELPDDLPIYRTGAIQPTGFYFDWKRKREGQPQAASGSGGSRSSVQYAVRSVGRRLVQALLVPDDKIGWLPFAYRTARSIIARHDAALILTTSPPYSANIVGAALARRTGLPWVADFRDPFLGSDLAPIPTPLHRALYRQLERNWVQRARRVISVSPKMSAAFARRYPDLAPEKWATILNGYDENDFAGIETTMDNKTFTLRHIGTMYRNASPDPGPLIHAIRRFLDRNPEAASAFCLEFIGGMDSAWEKDLNAVVVRYDLDGNVRVRPPVSHAEAVRLMCSSTALLILLNEQSGAEYAIRAKSFEYLRARRPVLALAPLHGAMYDLLSPMDGFKFLAPTDTETIAAQLESWYRQWRDRSLPMPENHGTERFSRRHEAGQLADALNDVVARPKA